MHRLLPLALVLLLAAGCATNETPALERPLTDTAPPEAGADHDAEDVVSGVGTIRWMDLEGGFWGLVADDGTNYDPLNLGDDFHEDGLRVRFRAVRQDVATIRMWGTPVEVLEMMKL